MGGDYEQGQKNGEIKATTNMVYESVRELKQDLKEFSEKNDKSHEKLHIRIDIIWKFLAGTSGLGGVAAIIFILIKAL